MSRKYIKICWRFWKSALQKNADRERESLCPAVDQKQAAPKHNEIRIFSLFCFFCFLSETVSS